MIASLWISGLKYNIYKQRQEEDKTILSMHKQRILDYEKNLYEKFQKVLKACFN